MMTYYNPTTKHFYRSGALRTKDGTIFNPTEATLATHGFEPYTLPRVEPEPVPAEEQRRMAYVAECDHLLIASLGYEAEGNTEAASACKAQYLQKKAEIRERIPDEDESQMS